MFSEINRVRCVSCGGDLIFDDGNLHAVCKSCGNDYYFKEEKNRALVLALNTANEYLLKADFDNAKAHYLAILKDNPNDSETAWGLLLSIYGVTYTPDDRAERMIPTCSRYVKENILESSTYNRVIANCAEMQRQKYQTEATLISRLQNKIKVAIEEEEPFDVFISYKSKSDDNAITEDSVIARQIYNELTKIGVKTFFSEVTLQDRLGDDYEPIIYRALYSCKFFILVSTKEDYLESAWVKNEWTRFRDRAFEENLSSACALVFKDFNPHNTDLPRLFQNQGIDLAKHPYDYPTLIADNLKNKFAINKESEQDKAKLAEELEEQKKRNEQLEQMQLKMQKDFELRQNQLRNEIEQRFNSSSVNQSSSLSLVERAFMVGLNVHGSEIVGVNRDIKDCVIPNGITSIAPGAFENNKTLERLVMPDSITTIRGQGFCGCSKLKTLVISKNVTKLPEQFLSGCTSLVEISVAYNPNLPLGILNLPNQTTIFRFEKALKRLDIRHEPSEEFHLNEILRNISENNVTWFSLVEEVSVNGVQIKEVTVGPEVKVISKEYGSTLHFAKRIVLSEGVEEIGEYAFSSSNVESIKIPSTLKKIGKEAFRGVANLTVDIQNLASWCAVDRYEREDGDGYVGWNASQTSFLINGKDAKVVNVPVGVEKISRGCFSCFTDLEKVFIPEGVKEIDCYAFRECKSLRTVSLPNSLKIIGKGAFEGSGIEEIVIPEGLKVIPYCAFMRCENLEKVILPKSLQEIGEFAFNDCSSLQNLTLPENISTIGKGAFETSGIRDIIIPNGVREIKESTFRCSVLENIVLPEQLERIGRDAFSTFSIFESNLLSIRIPKGLKSVGENAFYKCNKLSTVYIDDLYSFCKISFNGENSNPLLQCQNAYLGDKPITKLEFKTCKAEISKELFENIEYIAQNITEIILPEGVELIGEEAFTIFKNVTEVTLPSTVKEIRTGAFKGCSQIKNVYFPDLASWCNISFSDLHANPLTYAHNFYINKEIVQTLVIPEGTPVVKSNTFTGGKSITKLVISEGVGEVQSFAFEYCYFDDILVKDPDTILQPKSFVEVDGEAGSKACFASAHQLFAGEFKNFTKTVSGCPSVVKLQSIRLPKDFDPFAFNPNDFAALREADATECKSAEKIYLFSKKVAARGEKLNFIIMNYTQFNELCIVCSALEEYVKKVEVVLESDLESVKWNLPYTTKRCWYWPFTKRRVIPNVVVEDGSSWHTTVKILGIKFKIKLRRLNNKKRAGFLAKKYEVWEKDKK